MDQEIPYLDLAAQMRPLRKEIDAAIAKTLDACTFCLGPDVAQFENEFAEFCGARHAIGFNSGTSALHVAMRLLGENPFPENGPKFLRVKVHRYQMTTVEEWRQTGNYWKIVETRDWSPVMSCSGT